MIEGVTTITILLTAKVSNNMRMNSREFTKGNYYICADASIPELTLEITKDMINYRQSSRILEEDLATLKTILRVENFCPPFSN